MRQRIKTHRYFISLTDQQDALLSEQMQNEVMRKDSGEQVSSYFAGLLVKIRDCKSEHRRGKAGRPRKAEEPEKQKGEWIDGVFYTEEDMKMMVHDTLACMDKECKDPACVKIREKRKL